MLLDKGKQKERSNQINMRHFKNILLSTMLAFCFVALYGFLVIAITIKEREQEQVNALARENLLEEDWMQQNRTFSRPETFTTHSIMTQNHKE
jgi:hypothetical protein